uniref:Peroxisomal membrane protein PEX16 n=1 Tax=Glossina morsitans morsitans TaxID=37546 RepID=A0A1B0FA34_GLOMM
MMEHLKQVIKAYEKWVASNPEVVCDVETTTKWVSYFIAGRISNSSVVSELVYTLSNIMVLYNDRIIHNSRQLANAARAANDALESEELLDVSGSKICYRLKVMLTTLEYCEVFLEISAKRVFSNRGKWIIIAILQTMKALGRYFILIHSTERIITTPTLPTLNRRTFTKKGNISKSSGNNKSALNAQSYAYKLKRSGRVVRRVEGAPPLQCRSFKLNEEINEMRREQVPKILIQAEYIYIAKPLIHLAAMGMFGQKSWKQYILALMMDLVSINIYQKNRDLMTKRQQLILSHRCINLLLYIVRSPVYERYTQSKLNNFLTFATNSIPIVKMLTEPLKEYIPHWQNTYYYLWST